jgi:hypothetical protein
VVDSLNQYFIPLYVDNDEAEEILRAHGKKPYAPQDWQLVQTHLIMPDGNMQELWRPGHNTGGDDPENLRKALERAIDEFDLKPQPPITNQHTIPSVDAEGLVIEVNLRYPKQPNFQHNHAYTVDWIQLSKADIQSIVEDRVSKKQASRILNHFRPPLDTASDLDEEALKLIDRARISLLPSEEDGILHFVGEMSIGGQELPVEAMDDKWSTIHSAEVQIQGFVTLSESSKVIDIQIVTTKASFVPPQGKEILFKAIGRMNHP